MSKEEKNELKRKAYKLHKNGLSSQQIADELGVSKTTAHSYVVSVANMEVDYEQNNPQLIRTFN
jgi:orotate phosphoribosyltransferase-like protein